MAPPSGDRKLELRGLARGLGRSPKLVWRRTQVPRGRGEPVMALPGFMSGDGATAVLRGWLRSVGWDARPWGVGFNTGQVERLLPRAEARLAALAERGGGPVRLVGWSLGGVIARELARRRPELVERIVTLGSPVRGGPKYTRARAYYEQRGFDLDAIEARIHARNMVTIAAPITAIYSKRDAIVAWQSCLDPNPDNQVEHLEVDATHLELGFCPDVLELVARRLAAPR